VPDGTTLGADSQIEWNWSTETLPTDLTRFEGRFVRKILIGVTAKAAGGAHRQRAVPKGALSDQHYAQRNDQIGGR
jgi:hypothetical protein